jgi:hypothetical protein
MKIQARADRFFAILAGRDALPSSQELLLVRIESGRGHLLAEPDSIAEFTPTFSRWIALRPTGKGFLYTLDYPSEAVVGTVVYVPQGDVMQRLVADSTACRPTELSDANGDGAEDLVSYVDDPSNQNCVSSCHFAMREQTGAEPAWVTVRSWNGSAWALDTLRTRSFYARWARQYARAAAWLATAEGKESCDEGWANPDRFRDWASHAKQLAERGGS